MQMFPDEYYYYMQKTPAVRNRRAISTQESKDYWIDIDKVETDDRTTIMVRNIPNKYTQDMLLQLFEKNHKKKFDFFYLPIDYNVDLNLFRIIAMLVTLFLTSFIPSLLLIFTKISTKENGTNSIQLRFAKYATPEFKELPNSKITLSTQMSFSKEIADIDH